MDLENSKNEVHRKIGRNIMLFQKVEGLLKFITVHNQIGAHISQLKTQQEKLIENTENKTMGQLVNEHL